MAKPSTLFRFTLLRTSWEYSTNNSFLNQGFPTSSSTSLQDVLVDSQRSWLTCHPWLWLYRSWAQRSYCPFGRNLEWVATDHEGSPTSCFGGRIFFSVFQRPAVKRVPFKIAKKKTEKDPDFPSPGTRKIQDYNIWSIRNVLPNHRAFPNIWLVLLNPNRSRLENDHPKHTIIINYHQSSSQIGT